MKTKSITQHQENRAGFTLVEMLVSVTLVILMMTMFTQIFTIATDGVKSQQANGESDQKSRTLSTVIRNDLRKRTMRTIVPFFPGELNATSPTSFANRTGYFYVSCNDPNSGLDDLIQFTIDANQTQESADTTPFFGRAAQLFERGLTGAQPLREHPNQPETDDGNLTPNLTASSPAAQVCYFIRNGNLYRRVLLIRNPLRVGGQILSPQPTSGNGVDYFGGLSDPTDNSTFDGQFIGPTTGGLTNDFHAHFDFSAISQNPGGLGSVARLLGTESLSNDITGAGRFSLGIPAHRFGFGQDSGLSREHFTQAPIPGNLHSFGFFLGRPLHAETSTENWNWPQGPAQRTDGSILWTDGNSATTDGNPYEMFDGAGNLVTPYTANANGLITNFGGPASTGGSRAVEDLLLTNVHEFSIELWDERLGDYAPIGHQRLSSGVPGDLHLARGIQAVAGPVGASASAATGVPVAAPVSTRLAGPMGSAPRAFDTWHSSNLTTPQQRSWPPFMPTVWDPPHQPAGPTPTAIAIPSENKGYYNPVGTYAVDDIVFAFNDVSGGPWTAGDPATPPDGIFNTHGQSLDTLTGAGFQRAYRCINATGTPAGALLGSPSTTIGQRLSDGGVQWEVIDNTRPIRSMRITVRFLNQKSNNIRQLTLVIPLRDQT